jgi:hypothetical protein
MARFGNSLFAEPPLALLYSYKREQWIDQLKIVYLKSLKISFTPDQQ